MTRWLSRLAAAAIAFSSTVALAGLESAVNVSRSALDSLTPVVARVGSTVHVAWIESEPTTDGLRATVVAARSLDGGGTFEPPVVVAPLDGYASGLQMAASGGRVHLAWLATTYTTGSPSAIDYVGSSDDGATYSPVRVVSADAPPGIPDLAAEGDDVAVVWSTDSSVWLAHSGDGGDRFEAPRSVTSHSVDGTARVAVDEGRAAVVWLALRDGGRAPIARTVDLKDLAAPAVELRIGEATAALAEARVAFDAETVVAVWNRGGELALARSTNAGAGFDAETVLGAADSIARPSVAFLDQVAHVVWLAPRATVTYGRLVEGSFTSRRLGRKAVFPNLDASGPIVSIVWQARSGSGTRIRIAVSTDGGATFRRARSVTRRRDGASAARVTSGDTGGLVVFEAPVGPTRDVYFARES